MIVLTLDRIIMSNHSTKCKVTCLLSNGAAAHRHGLLLNDRIRKTGLCGAAWLTRERSIVRLSLVHYFLIARTAPLAAS